MHTRVVKWLSAANIPYSLLTSSILPSSVRRHECMPKQNVRIRQGLVTRNTRCEFPPKSLSWMMEEMPGSRVFRMYSVDVGKYDALYTCSCLDCVPRIRWSIIRSSGVIPNVLPRMGLISVSGYVAAPRGVINVIAPGKCVSGIKTSL